MVWSPLLPFTKNQPPIVVATTRPTASTTAPMNVPERVSYMEELLSRHTIAAKIATKKHKRSSHKKAQKAQNGLKVKFALLVLVCLAVFMLLLVIPFVPFVPFCG